MLAHRRVVGLLAGLALCSGLLACGGDGKPAPARRHLLLISIDTLRADRLGAYGHDAAATPHLDQLAGEGLRFAQVASTAPLTLPAHASLLTGSLPPQHGLRENGVGRLRDDLWTLAAALRAAGYRSGAFVGAFVLDHRFGLQRGFEVYDDEIDRPAGAASRLEAERSAAEVVDRALAWLATTQDDPVFAWVHLYDPHAPYLPPEPFRSHHADQPYDGEIAYVDAQLGRLRAALETDGRWPQTVVAVVGDHGESLGEHGEATHGLLLYEGALHIPWLLRAPGLKAGRVVETPVSLADVGPTLAGLLGVSPPTLPEGGRDLAAALLAGREPPDGMLYAETAYPALFGWSPLAMARHGVTKYIAAPRPELYDLERDPRERESRLEDQRREAHALRAHVEAVRKSAMETAPATIDGETRARLAALGYAGAVSSGRPDLGEGADPKDRVDDFRAWEAATRTLEAGESATAVAALEPLVAADPGNPVFRGSLARAAREAGDLERALGLYREAIAAAPDDADGWYNLAAAYKEAGRLQEALAAATEALRHDPRRPDAMNLLGLALLAGGDPAAAAAQLQRAVDLDPRHAVAWNNLGNVLRVLNRGTEAAAAYQRAVALAADYADPHNGLGALAVEADRPAAALRHFQTALRLAPDFHEARLNLGIAQQMLGQAAAAAATYRELLRRIGDDPRHASQRQAALALLQRLE